MVDIEFHARKDGSTVAGVRIGNQVIVMSIDEWKKTAAQILRAMPSKKRSNASRKNGKLGGRPRNAK